VLNFPEGTTTDGRALLPFRRGVFGAARLAKVPIVPVAIDYESPSLAWVGDEDFLPHYLRTAARPRTAVRVAFGSPMQAGRAARDDRAVAAAARASIERLLKGA
jgi:1-acyl-sn-glycerol-3-phosphate acyltransferase